MAKGLILHLKKKGTFLETFCNNKHNVLFYDNVLYSEVT